jgi:hypothetical protein
VVVPNCAFFAAEPEERLPDKVKEIFSAASLTTLGFSRQVPWHHCTTRTELKLAVCDAAATLELAEKALRLPTNLVRDHWDAHKGKGMSSPASL